MSCQEARELLHGYIDGELDLVRSLEIERHLRGCADCAEMERMLSGMCSAIRGNVPYFKTPGGLEKRITSGLRRASGRQSPHLFNNPVWRWAGVAAAALLGLFVGSALWLGRSHSSETDLLAAEAVASHVRSLMASHLTDVPSSDSHTVKPWFEGKLDFSPTVFDFSDRGFPLAGGRLDYLKGRRVAALVYRRRKHVINLFVWPDPDAADSPVQAVARQGYQELHWTRHRAAYWAVSDLNAGELREFAALVRNPG